MNWHRQNFAPLGQSRRDGGFGCNPSCRADTQQCRARPIPGHDERPEKRSTGSNRSRDARSADKNKTATFSGNVQVVQGDTTMKCQSLVVFYGQWRSCIAGNDKAAPAATPATTSKSTPGMPQGAQYLRRFEALGGVTVITKDQNASGDTGIYDLKSKTITLSAMSWSARVRTSFTARRWWSIRRPMAR